MLLYEILTLYILFILSLKKNFKNIFKVISLLYTNSCSCTKLQIILKKICSCKSHASPGHKKIKYMPIKIHIYKCMVINFKKNYFSTKFLHERHIIIVIHLQICNYIHVLIQTLRRFHNMFQAFMFITKPIHTYKVPRTQILFFLYRQSLTLFAVQFDSGSTMNNLPLGIHRHTLYTVMLVIGENRLLLEIFLLMNMWFVASILIPPS